MIEYGFDYWICLVKISRESVCLFVPKSA